MSNKEILEFMQEYSDSFLEGVKESGDATKYHANSLKYFGMKMLINAVAKEMGDDQCKDDDEYIGQDDWSENSSFSASEENEGARYGVNVCSFRYKKHAEELKNEVSEETDYRAFVEKGNGFYRVRIGYYENKKEAEEIMHELKKAGYENSCVCTEDDESREKISSYAIKKLKKFDMKQKTEPLGEITLGEKVYVGDPSFFCSGQRRYSKIENVLPGTYVCSLQKTYTVIDKKLLDGTVDCLEVKHADYDKFQKKSLYKTSVSIYSTVAGVFDNSAVEDFIKLVEETQKSIGSNDKFKKWTEDILNCTCKRVPNPEYVPFEKSKFWNDKFLELQESDFSADCLADYQWARAGYDALKLQETISDWESGGTIGNTAVVFGHLEMADEEVVYEVEENEDGKVIAIKFIVNDFTLPVFNFSK